MVNFFLELEVFETLQDGFEFLALSNGPQFLNQILKV